MSKHEEIARLLTRDILTGQYRVGERLPSERDLAARFDASRGAVREAMKKLEQLGIADIQPGGARVLPLNEASLDVIGHLLSVRDKPSRELVDQILVVINALVQTAVIAALQREDEQVLRSLRELIRPIWSAQLDLEAFYEAQTNMFRGVMAASGNLPVQLIAKSLLDQFGPQMAFLRDYAVPDMETHRALAREMDAALAARDLEAVRRSFAESSKFHRERTQKAFDAYEAAETPARLEASAS
ncbi:MAG: FadR/GntR family transcriptional regulator [Pseudomonadales bacterium]